MIPNRLIHEHQEALIEAAQKSALLNLHSLQRISQYSFASRRALLQHTGTRGKPEHSFAIDLPMLEIGKRSLNEYRHYLEVANDAYVQWTDLCANQWQGVHDRMQSALAYYADHAPGEAGLAMRLAQRANDLAVDAADRVADGRKSALSAVVGELMSTLPEDDDPMLRKPAKRSRKGG